MKRATLARPDPRIATMTAAECREYSRRYFAAARDVRRKYGRRAAYRYEWLDGAWQFRQASRQEGRWN